MRFVTLLAAAFLVCAPAPAPAQSTIGAHYSALSLEYPDQIRHGAGAFFVYAPREWLGADVSATLFSSEPIGGRAWQVTAGPRVGGTWNGIGLFARARPGLVHFAERFYKPEVVCIAIFPPPDSCLVDATNLTLDLGGTIELPLFDSSVVRVDVGDTMTRYRTRVDDHAWTHALQLIVGAGWRF